MTSGQKISSFNRKQITTTKITKNQKKYFKNNKKLEKNVLIPLALL